MEDLREYLKSVNGIIHMDNSFISKKMDMTNFSEFYDFVKERYSLEHMREFNYIKYVKVKREMLTYYNTDNYVNKIQQINNILKELNKRNVLNYIDFKKYLFKIYNIFDVFKKKIDLNEKSICRRKHFISLIQFKDEQQEKDLKSRVLYSVDKLKHKNELIYEKLIQIRKLILEFIEIEKKHDINHDEIAKSCSYRKNLGLRSEDIVYDTINNYVKKYNTYNNNEYIYVNNINLLKLFNINMDRRSKIYGEIKGEADGILLKKQNNTFIIECIIEVKSTIKATFEDTPKFITFKDYITKQYTENPNLIYEFEDYTFTKESFVNIMNKPMKEWTLYLCVGDKDIVIEKSHLFFVNCLKIVDAEFIKRYYINNDETVISDKFKVIVDNAHNIDESFKLWCMNMNIANNSNLFLYQLC